MGSVFAEEVLGIDDPRVRLLSIGEEPEKGNQLTLDAHALLRRAPLRFAGNTEGRDCFGGDDVIVCDGFTGNVALKMLEGTITQPPRRAAGGDRADDARVEARRPADPARRAARLRARLDPDTYGGAYLLGLRGLAVIAHGSSSQVRDRERDQAGRAGRSSTMS